MKDTSCSIDTIRDRVKILAGSKLLLLNANTRTLLDSLDADVYGFCGIGSNYMPQLYAWLCQNFSSEPQLAAELQKFLAANEALMEGSTYPASAKHYLRLRGLEIGSHSRQIPGGISNECAEQLAALGAGGYAIGGLSVGEPRELSLAMVEATMPLLPREAPRYVMGVGMPGELAEYVARGVDMMDCVLPSRNARNGYLFTSRGRVVIKQARYADDPRPPDEACDCSTCRRYSRAYLRHLFQAGEMLYSTLATIHNLHHYLDIMRRIRQSILRGSFPRYLDEVRSSRVV